jgi:Transposase IS116/IS110/IS902 family
VAGYGQARGWSPSTLRRVQHSLAALLASQPTPAWPLEAAAVRQFLHERRLTVLRVVEFLADQGLVRVDEHATLDRWLARRLQPLAAPIQAVVQVWIQGLRGRGPRAGRRRRAATIQGYLRAATPALADWPARHQSLRQVTTQDIAAQLEPLAGPTRKLTLAVLRSLFRTLKARRLTFTNPTAGLATPRAPPPPALGLAPARRAGLLGRLDRPDQRPIVLLAGVHALRPHQIRVLMLDAVDLAAGILGVGGRPRRLDGLTLKALGGWLELRRVRWPASANPYLLVNQSTAGGLTPVTRGYIQEVFGRLGLTAEDLRVDRLLAEVGLDMGQFPTPAHLVSWARLSPCTIQSGTTHRAGATGKGNPYLKSVLGEAATAAAKTDTFLGERYRRLVRRIGKRKALVAVARSILVIVWHLLADPTARFHDLGADYHASRIDRDRRTRNLVHQLQALGHKVTLQPAA